MIFYQENNFGGIETELFNASILEQLSLSQIEGLLIRPLKSDDYDRGKAVAKNCR